MDSGNHITAQFRRLKQLVNASLANLRFWLGVETPVAIFMYHSIHPDGNRERGPWQYAMTPKQFELHLQALTEAYQIESLSSIIADCMDGQFPEEPTAAITFDDGFQDNLTQAIPLLERYELPATVFVANSYIDGPPPYEYRLAEAVWDSSEVEVITDGISVTAELTDYESYSVVYEQLQRNLKFNQDRVEDVLAEINGSTAEAPSMLTADQLRKLSRHPLIEIGAHGNDHVPLTTMDKTILRRKLREEQEFLTALLDTSVKLFSYPYGDYSQDVIKAVANTGFQAAVTTNDRRIAASDIIHKMMALPRIDAATYS